MTKLCSYVITTSFSSPADLPDHHELPGPDPVLEVAHPRPSEPVLREDDDVRPRLLRPPDVAQVLINVEGEHLFDIEL